MKNLFVLFLIASLSSCKKNNDNDDCNWMCNEGLILDSMQTAETLIGTWHHTRSNGGLLGETCETLEYPTEPVYVTFNANGTCMVWQNGLQWQTNWQVEDKDPSPENQVWGIKTNPEYGYADNTIASFCSNNRLYLVANYFIIADGSTAEYERQ